jgi:DME family drug/metabolite transporter
MSQTQLRADRSGFLLIAIAAILWGTVGVSTKTIYTLSETTPLSVGFFRLVIAAPTLWIAAAALLRGQTFTIERRAALPSVLIGGMLALYQLCYFTSITYVGVAIATLITLCGAPVMVALIESLLARAWLSRRVLLAMGLALGGTVLLVGWDQLSTGSANLIGIAFALGSAFGYAVVTVVGRRIAGWLDPIRINALAFSSGALLLLLLTAPQGLVIDYSLPAWGIILYLGLVPTAFAYGLFLRGMQTASATTASIITLMEPLTATMLAWLLFGERLGAWGIVGALILVAALWLVSTE